MKTDFSLFVELLIHSGFPEILTYGLKKEQNLEVGHWVWVSLGRRAKPQLALIINIHDKKPPFKVKGVEAHPANFKLCPVSLENLLWTAKYYCTPPGIVLQSTLAKEFPRYLEHLYNPPKRKLRTFSPDCDNPQAPPPLNLEQQAAVEKISPLLAGDGFRGVLLHGVTGSGKTRVYVELVRQHLEQQGKVLILVPEIALTPQTRDNFQRYLGEPVYLYHSNLSAPEKRATWLALLKDEARIVLGTRSAIFAPNLNPSLIIIDEEHDGSYKQQDPAPRYHCRELAFHHAYKHGALVVLGSATPSLESYQLAKQGQLHLVELKKRALNTPLPEIQVVDLMAQAKQDKNLTLSPILRETLTEHLLQGNQAIILHNRRGFATSRQCLNCGEILQCEQCQVPVVWHKQHHGLLCHYCNRIYKLENPCSCGCEEFEMGGAAIEQVEEEIRQWTPQAKVLRMDRDTVARIGASEKLLNAFRQGEYNVLLGTQMVAKGHDFPQVQLVGVISADLGAALPDFRSSERLFQLLTQVAGRAGRAQQGGEVILQTRNPQNPVLQYALQHDYPAFANYELPLRQELQYPPFKKLLAIEIAGKNLDRVEKLCSYWQQVLAKQKDIEALGPAEAFIAVIKGMHRRHFLLKGDNTQILRHISENLQKTTPEAMQKGLNIRFDIDPMGFV